MKTMKSVLFLVLFSLVFFLTATAAPKGEKTVVYKATLHCASCKAKVEKNIAFEKGVKALDVDLDKQTITVTFRADKNNAENIRKAIEKLNVPVSGFSEKKVTDGKEKAGKGKTKKTDEAACQEDCE